MMSTSKKRSRKEVKADSRSGQQSSADRRERTKTSLTVLLNHIENPALFANIATAIIPAEPTPTRIMNDHDPRGALKATLDSVEHKFGLKLAKEEYARRASASYSAADHGMATRGHLSAKQLANALSYMSPKERRQALKTYYPTDPKKTWAKTRKEQPTPEEFLAWLEERFPDRCIIGMRQGDLKHLDKPAYQKLMGWVQPSSPLYRKNLPDFGLPPRAKPKDSQDVPAFADVRKAYKAGDPDAPRLEREYHQGHYIKIKHRSSNL